MPFRHHHMLARYEVDVAVGVGAVDERDPSTGRDRLAHGRSRPVRLPAGSVGRGRPRNDLAVQRGIPWSDRPRLERPRGRAPGRDGSALGDRTACRINGDARPRRTQRRGGRRGFCVGGCCPGVLKDFGDDQNLLAHDWGAGLLADAPRARAAAWRDAVSCKTRSAAVSVNATFKGRSEISPLAGLECGPGDGVNAPVAAA
jgi:hypothetical protein